MKFDAAPGLAEQIAAYLEKQIITGDLPAKERIPEIRITQNLKVSRGSVREALLLLSRRHLVTLIPRKGAVVTELSEGDITHLYDMLVCLYSLLAERAATCWKTLEELVPFQKLLEKMHQKAEEKNALAVLQLTFQFLEEGCTLVQNPYLTESLQNLKPVFSRAFYLGLSSESTELHKIIEVLEEIIACIFERKTAPLNEIIQRYATHQKEMVLRAYQEKKLSKP